MTSLERLRALIAERAWVTVASRDDGLWHLRIGSRGQAATYRWVRFLGYVRVPCLFSPWRRQR